MFGHRVRVDKELLDKVKKYAAIAGYSSAEEFVTHALEKEIAALEEAEAKSDEKLKERLKGLGYIS